MQQQQQPPHPTVQAPGQPSGSTKRRKSYAKPVLVRYGDVVALTRSGGTSAVSDSGNNHMSPFHG